MPRRRFCRGGSRGMSPDLSTVQGQIEQLLDESVAANARPRLAQGAGHACGGQACPGRDAGLPAGEVHPADIRSEVRRGVAARL